MIVFSHAVLVECIIKRNYGSYITLSNKYKIFYAVLKLAHHLREALIYNTKSVKK